MKKIAISLILVSAAAAVQAQIAFDQKDPAAGVFAQLKAQTNSIATPSSAAQAAPVAAPAAEAFPIAGKPVGSDRIDVRSVSNPIIQLVLVVNNDGDRVGVRADVTADNPPGTDQDFTDSDTFQYLLPGLRYDKAAKKVYCGDVLIARDRGFWHGGLRLEKGYELQYKKATHKEDYGFDRGGYEALEVSLSKK